MEKKMFNGVSIIMPAFNSENTIVKSIESILSQNFKNFELIVVDDGSTDSTFKIVSDFASVHDNINVIYNTGLKGPSGARNTGLKYASGKYISFLDSDDLWFPNHLQEGVSFLEDNIGIDIVYFNFEVIEYDSQKKIGDWFTSHNTFANLNSKDLYDGYKIIKGNIFIALIEESFMHLQSSVIRNSSNLILFDEKVKRSEDRDFFIRCFKDLNFKFAFKNVLTGIYFRHTISLTSNSVQNSIMTLNDHVYLFQKYLNNYEISLTEKEVISKKIYNRQLELSYNYRNMNNSYLALRSLMKGLRYHIDYNIFTEFIKILVFFLKYRLNI